MTPKKKKKKLYQNAKAVCEKTNKLLMILNWKELY